MPAEPGGSGAFGRSQEQFWQLVGFLESSQAAGFTHAELENLMDTDGRELLRQILQNHLDLRACRETRLLAVTDASGIDRPRSEGGHQRQLATTLGVVGVTRIAYRRPGEQNLHPADAALNLPDERHSHGLRRLAAIESSRGSFDDAREAITRATGQELGKRQLEDLARSAACDIEAFYDARKPTPGNPDDVLVLSVDGKGIVMRREGLRPATAAAAEAENKKLPTRLSKGEKANRKRMAELGVVYDATPVPRSPADILVEPGTPPGDITPGPKATGKWLTASVVNNASAVVSRVFDEAERRDPAHARTWVGLVDGNRDQIKAITKQAAARGVDVHLVIDFIHVMEYLWKATWCFHAEGAPAAESWVNKMAVGVLKGKATVVAGIIRRAATRAGLAPAKREGVDACAKYLTNKSPYLDYPTALNEGWPIATGVIEGACRHLVKDRLAITGARWGLEGAEAVLKLRALRCNGDWDVYWKFHLAQEHRRVHESRYVQGFIARAA